MDPDLPKFVRDPLAKRILDCWKHTDDYSYGSRHLEAKLHILDTDPTIHNPILTEPKTNREYVQASATV
jgi:hypothetical protein